MPLIYIVSGDPGTAKSLGVFLGRIGHDVEVFTDPKQALTLIGEHRPPLVIIDGSPVDMKPIILAQTVHRTSSAAVRIIGLVERPTVREQQTWKDIGAPVHSRDDLDYHDLLKDIKRLLATEPGVRP